MFDDIDLLDKKKKIALAIGNVSKIFDFAIRSPVPNLL